jgi:hypothetical protein
MALPLARSSALIPPLAPRLPSAPVEYDRQTQENLLNTLRLYFNTIDNFCQSFSSGTAGAYLQFPYGAFEDVAYTTLNGGITNAATTITVVSTTGFPTAGQIRIENEIITYTGVTTTTFTGCTRGTRGSTNVAHSTAVGVIKIQSPGANTAASMYLNTTDYNSNVSIVDTTKITAAKTGLYNLQWSGQFGNTDTADNDASIWLRINGVDVTGSTGLVSIPSSHGGTDGHTIIGWNYYVKLTAGQYVEIWWSTTNQKVMLECYAPTTSPTRPATAAVVATLSFVSAI